MPRKTRSLAERFWEKVRKSDGCWEWGAATREGGYGVIQLGRGRGTKGAHIVAYELEVGPTEGRWVLHRCDNPPCVRPDHLFLGDVNANNQDMIEKGRAWYQAKDACHNGHPYTEENTYIDTAGRKRCRVCRRATRRVVRSPEEQQEMRRRMGTPRRERTHCPQGHPYSAENTRINSRGSRVCRTCERARRNGRR